MHAQHGSSVHDGLSTGRSIYNRIFLSRVPAGGASVMQTSREDRLKRAKVGNLHYQRGGCFSCWHLKEQSNAMALCFQGYTARILCDQ